MSSDSDDSTKEALHGLHKSMASMRSNVVKLGKRWREQSWACESAARKQSCEHETKRMKLQSTKLDTKADVMDNLSEMLEYTAILTRLMGNDKDIRAVDATKFPLGHGKALTGALRHNTVVEQLDLNLDRFLANHSEYNAKEEMKGLFEFLSDADNSSLIDIRVRGNRESDFRYISSLLLEGISKCKQLQRLTWEHPISPTLFQQIMTTLPFLHELYLCDNGSSDPYTADEQQAVASAFLSNSSLQKLKLYMEDEDILAAWLIALRESRSLQELALYDYVGSDSFYDAISQYLRYTCTLKRLKMHQFVLTGSCMTKVLSGLRHPGNDAGGLPTTHLEKLAFVECHIREEAIEPLVSFLKTPTTDRAGNQVFVSCLNELYVDVEIGLTESFAERMADSLLMATEAHDQDDDASLRTPMLLPTIGSQIKAVSVDVVPDNFFYHLRDNADRVRLQMTQLDVWYDDDGLVFFECIPKLVSLRKLYIHVNSRSDLNPDWILLGLRATGSVLDVEIKEKHRGDFSAEKRCIIDAYCQRNRLLGTMIESDPRPVDTDANRGDGEAANGTAGAAANADLLVRPALLQCATQIPSTHASMLIRGLTALDQHIGTEESDHSHGPM